MTDKIDVEISERVEQVQKDIKALEALAQEHGKNFDLDIGLNFGGTFQQITVDEDYGVAREYDARWEESDTEHEWGWNAWLPSSAYC
jgi:hypothetical protein